MVGESTDIVHIGISPLKYSVQMNVILGYLKIHTMGQSGFPAEVSHMVMA